MRSLLQQRTFLDDDFLLEGKMARALYHEVASGLPIIDYHSHLPAKEIAQDRRFENLAELWLEGDHYKWRAMRANGVDEVFCTGNADPYDKFLAYCRSMPCFLRNPLYHWSHLELERLFGIDCRIDEGSAPAIWETANARLAEPAMSARGILRHFNVEVVCSTDDPTDPLDHHVAANASGSLPKCLPTFRPDGALGIRDPDTFAAWLAALSRVSGVTINSLDTLEQALGTRHEQFHAAGCRLSDHGLEQCFGGNPDRAKAAEALDRALAGETIDQQAFRDYASHLMVFFGMLDAEKGWTKQLHLGAHRNVNTTRVGQLGRDTGFDSIGDFPQARGLGAYLDHLESLGALPRTILYNLNPADNYLFASIAGNFQDGSIPGKVQFGAGWWFLDQKEGIEWQLNALSNLGLLSRFVGMLTDSRSFLSFPRHEYFRRIFCNLLGNDVDKGLLPDDFELLARLVRDVCYHNAKNYFRFDAA
jgi:glucuronate isomerase